MPISTIDQKGLTNPLTSVAANTVASASGSALTLQTNGSTTAVTIDTSQNVGVGITPSTWNTDFKPIDVSNYASFYGRVSTPTAGVSQNAYRNTAGTWTYKGTGAASRYEQDSGLHIWYNAASGTAGNPITFTQAMTLNANGSVLLGNSRFSPTANIAATNYYNEEKIFQISTSSASYDICTVTSGYASGALMIEVAGTIQFAALDQRSGSNRKAMITFTPASIVVTDLYTNYVGGFGTINFTYVSAGVIKINVTGSYTGFGQGNGIAWVKVVGGQNSSGSTVTPLGFTIS